MVSSTHINELKHLVRDWKFIVTRPLNVKKDAREAPAQKTAHWLWRDVDAYRTESSGVDFSKRGGQNAADERVEL